MRYARDTTDGFLQKARMVHGDIYDYSLSVYTGWNKKIIILCRDHGLFNQKPTIHLQGKGCPKCGVERITACKGEDSNISEMYQNGLSARAIGDKLGTSDKKVFSVLRKMGVVSRRVGRRTSYLVNHNYFNKIDTQEKAYWLGWMASDGFVVRDRHNHVIGLCLQERDREILNGFRDAIGADNPIRTITHKNGKTYLDIRVVSLQMVMDLAELGVVPNKSLILKKPEIPVEFEWDFFRGVFDGDGCVGKRSISLCGTKEMVESFADLCRKSEYGCQVYKHSLGENTWYMRSSGRNARGILGKMYGSGICLRRKRDKAFEWIERFSGKDSETRVAA